MKIGRPFCHQPVVQIPDGRLDQGFSSGDKEKLETQHIFQEYTQDEYKQQASLLV